MRVSTRGDYASRALLSLALHGAETPTSVRDIAERTGLPQPYLEQILLALKGAGLVRSKRGVGGGYVLARPPEEISLAQIVSAVDGPIAAGDFGEPHENGACDHEGQCVLLAVWADVGETIRTAPPVLQPGRHGRPGPGQRGRPRSDDPAPAGPALEPGTGSTARSPASRAPSRGRRSPRRRGGRAAPATGGSPSQRAASTRSTCPWATHRVSPAVPAPARSPGRPGGRRPPPAPLPARRRPRGSSRAAPRGSRRR